MLSRSPGVEDGYNRDVVRLLRACSMPSHGLEHAKSRFTRASARCGLEVRHETLLSEELLIRVVRLADAVGVEDESFARLEVQRLAGDVVERAVFRARVRAR